MMAVKLAFLGDVRCAIMADTSSSLHLTITVLITTEQEKLSLQHLKTLLVNEQYAAIVLVDVGLLYGRPNEDYSGHYIVVLDYIAHTEEFVCLNPAHGPGK